MQPHNPQTLVGLLIGAHHIASALGIETIDAVLAPEDTFRIIRS